MVGPRLFVPLLFVVGCIGLTTAPARAGDDDLEDDGGPKGTKAVKQDEGFGTYTAPPVATVTARTFTLAECLSLTDRNHPNLWAAKARVALVHAQLDEARWTPYWNWSASSNIGVLPPIAGTVNYTSTPASALNLKFGDGVQPVFTFDISGALPIYTFGKITAIREAAQAQVRVNEWDLEKFRQMTRMDVRRAYFGLLLARDAGYIINDVLAKVNKGIEGIKTKLAKGDTSVEEIDRLRLEVYRDEITARSGEPLRGETYALAALRFMTGVQTAFDIPDEPLRPPDTSLAPVVRYLSAARLFRPEVGMARAGIAARQAYVEYQRAKYFPDIGIGVFGSYAVAPSVATQNIALFPNPYNHFYAGAGLGVRWNLDLLPNSARVAAAESQLEETRALERLALGGIAVEVENAYAIVLEARTREEAWGRAEQRAMKWITTIQTAIDLGTKDERALIEPLRVYVNSRVQHTQSLMDLNVAMSDLARISGWDAAAPTGS